jgi:cell division protein FtsZ
MASEEGRAENAAKKAIESPLLEASIEGAKGVLINITGGNDLGIHEANEAAKVIQEVSDPDANIILGAVIDDDYNNEVKVTVIATGFDRDAVQKKVKETQEVEKDLETDFDMDNFEGDELDIPAFLRKK